MIFICFHFIFLLIFPSVANYDDFGINSKDGGEDKTETEIPRHNFYTYPDPYIEDEYIKILKRFRWAFLVFTDERYGRMRVQAMVHFNALKALVKDYINIISIYIRPTKHISHILLLNWQRGIIPLWWPAFRKFYVVCV